MTEIDCLFIAVTKRYLRIGVYDFVLVERKTVVRFASELQFQKLIISFDELLTAVKGYFDFIVDTVSASHDFRFYLGMLRTDGTHILVGLPSQHLEIPPFSIVGGRKSVAGSSIGGIPETQEMLDYCAEKNIVSDIELININYINQAYDRMLKGDVRYRFVIDMATL